jgi:hypothetical protein
MTAPGAAVTGDRAPADATGEALRALAVLAEPPCAEHAAIARALGLPPPPTADEHTDVLVFQAYPYAAVYLGAEGMLGGEARDRIAGFWRAIGAEPPREPDHASTLLAALAALADAEAGAADDRHAAGVRAARAALYREHVASWMPPFLATLRRIGPGFFAAWADTVAAVLADLAGSLAPPSRPPLHLRAAPPLAGTPASLDELLAVLLAPVRTGVVIVRADLARGARELGLGLRAGERRFALRGLFAQDAPGVLAWLAAEARRQAAAYAAGGAAGATWWTERATAAASWLDGLAATARDA